MFKHRVHYWSCSPLADWLRGTKKPYALTTEEWEDWRTEAKTKRPIRYFVAEHCLNKLQDFFLFPCDLFRNLRSYYYNRWVSKSHVLDTGFKPGSYYELDERILHALFNELVNFVEIELAWMHVIGDKKQQKKFGISGRKGRSPEAGLAYLEWASNLKCEFSSKHKDEPSPQAISSQKIRELYTWWKNRPNRPDPTEVSGWDEYCQRTGQARSRDKEENKRRMSIYKKLEKIERQYEKEDEQKLIELIKIRKHLWT